MQKVLNHAEGAELDLEPSSDEHWGAVKDPKFRSELKKIMGRYIPATRNNGQPGIADENLSRPTRADVTAGRAAPGVETRVETNTNELRRDGNDALTLDVRAALRTPDEIDRLHYTDNKLLDVYNKVKAHQSKNKTDIDDREALEARVARQAPYKLSLDRPLHMQKGTKAIFPEISSTTCGHVTRAGYVGEPTAHAGTEPAAPASGTVDSGPTGAGELCGAAGGTGAARPDPHRPGPNRLNMIYASTPYAKCTAFCIPLHKKMDSYSKVRMLQRPAACGRSVRKSLRVAQADNRARRRRRYGRFKTSAFL
ncbi:hypothetical protein EVAR_96092_1 [Eumeta japonica]|uniref:Uncharacterized protein n=1 Tax=Eumeta variegata TaxID=151549 RepID=A0A4C1VDG2_EUMVA|nr:hypothetical protein EVAR_96092_1 [Eumeta japonica]